MTKKTLTSQQDEVVELRNEILKHLQEESKGCTTSHEELVGELVCGFSGIICPVLHSGGPDSADRVLESMIVYFSSKENLQALPEDVQESAIETLVQLHKAIKAISKRGNMMFDYANLYDLTKWVFLSEETKEDFHKWYLDKR